MAKVVAFPAMREIHTFQGALLYGDEWQRAYQSLEAAYMLATAQRDASDLLLRLCEEENERLRGILEQNQSA